MHGGQWGQTLISYDVKELRSHIHPKYTRHGAPAALTTPFQHGTESGTRKVRKELPSSITESMQDKRGVPTYLLGAPGTLGMDEETLFTGRGASTGAQIETFSKREQGGLNGYSETFLMLNIL